MSENTTQATIERTDIEGEPTDDHTSPDTPDTTDSHTTRTEKRPGSDVSTASSDRRRGAKIGSLGRFLSNGSLSIRSVILTVVVLAMAVAISALGWQLHDKNSQLAQANNATASENRAKDIALKYATGAAQMNYRDLDSWKGRLTSSTSSDLSNRLTQAATSMEQIVAPLQWISTAQPIAATVTKTDNGVYSVDCFVSVFTKNSQAPDGIQSTATYRLKIDSNQDWNIVDISGIGDNVTQQGQSGPP